MFITLVIKTAKTGNHLNCQQCGKALVGDRALIESNAMKTIRMDVMGAQ